MNTKPMPEMRRGEVYRHNKTGNLYAILFVCENTSSHTNELTPAVSPVVVYDAINQEKRAKYLIESIDHYARPLVEFFDTVNLSGVDKQRFEYIRQATAEEMASFEVRT